MLHNYASSRASYITDTQLFLFNIPCIAKIFAEYNQ